VARKKSSSSAGLLLVVLVPLLWLVFLAWQGMRNQERTIAGMQDDEANRQVRHAAEWLSGVTAKATPIPKYADPPSPGVPSPLDEVLDGDDAVDLLGIVNDPNAGSSPAGLPRQVLAAVRLYHMRRGISEAELIQMVTRRHPSVMTTTVLKELQPPPEELQAWIAFEALRPAIIRNPDLGWVSENRPCWLKDAGNEWCYLPASSVEKAIRALQSNTGDFKTKLSMGNAYPHSVEDPGLLAFAPLKNGNGLRIDIYSTGSGSFEEMATDARHWGMLSLGGAVSVCMLGVYLMHRTLARERHLSEMKSQFVASVSHELRSPVASIRLMAEALDAGKVDPATAGEFHRLIAREGTRLSTLVGNVLDHARIEQGRRIWKIEPCNIAELVSDTVRVMEPLAKEKDLTITLKTLPIDSAVDAGAIQQALVNLLDNAIKFSPPGGEIGVTMDTHEKSRTWEIRITDQGPGIPKKEQVRIFERFYRPGDELRRETQGTGIGLSLVKAIVEAHQGTALVESEPGSGSTFILRLPPV
jgi:signal transduction histidine kinase